MDNFVPKGDRHKLAGLLFGNVYNNARYRKFFTALDKTVKEGSGKIVLTRLNAAQVGISNAQDRFVFQYLLDVVVMEGFEKFVQVYKSFK